MKFKISDQEDPKALLQQLSADVESTRESVDLGSGHFGCATWDEDGEPGSRGCITISRLHRACQSGSIKPVNGAKDLKKVLNAFMELVIPEDVHGSLPWREQPLIRVVCPKVCASLENKTLTVQGFVYLRRL
jgi:hypothetical protein